MRTPKSARERFRHRRDKYRDDNPTCEVTLLLWGAICHEFRVDYERLGRDPVDIHHIAGSGSELHECTENYITVCRPIHEWMTDHSRAAFVICAWVKTRKGEADWDVWTALKSHYRLTALSTWNFRQACEQYACVEDMRLELLDGMVPY